MQQTEKYKLHKPEMTDNFSPEPISENMDTLEGELSRLDETAAALDARVTVLEADKVKMVLGTYTGNGVQDRDAQTVEVGFTPRAVFFPTTTREVYMITEAAPMIDPSCGLRMAQIVEGGFRVLYHSHSPFNVSNTAYYFVALV